MRNEQVLLHHRKNQQKSMYSTSHPADTVTGNASTSNRRNPAPNVVTVSRTRVPSLAPRGRNGGYAQSEEIPTDRRVVLAMPPSYLETRTQEVDAVTSFQRPEAEVRSAEAQSRAVPKARNQIVTMPDAVGVHLDLVELEEVRTTNADFKFRDELSLQSPQTMKPSQLQLPPSSPVSGGHSSSLTGPSPGPAKAALATASGEITEQPKTILDNIILAAVIAGIIVFVAFQIRQGVQAYDNPVTKSTVLNVSRTFPGLMICPYSVNQFPATRFGVCPKWSDDAYLAFDFNNYEDGSSSSKPNCPRPLVVSLRNSNVHSESKKIRSGSVCSSNTINSFNFGNLLTHGAVEDSTCCPASFHKEVIVKNIAPPKLPECDSCAPCNSWTPPKVRCLVFDPSNFEDDCRKASGLNPICNPMKEVAANSLDALQLFTVDSVFYRTFQNTLLSKHRAIKGTFRYSGLIPQPGARLGNECTGGDLVNPFRNAPSSSSATTKSLFDQGVLPLSACDNANVSIFGGLVAVMYDSDPLKGIPKELDFDGARTNTLSSNILGSAVLMSTKNVDMLRDTLTPNNCVVEVSPALEVKVTSQFDTIFTDTLRDKKIPVTTQSVTIQPSVVDQSALIFERWALSMSFSSSVSVVTDQVISLTLLTIISIIISTAGTLWGSQEKIKQGIILIRTKLGYPDKSNI